MASLSPRPPPPNPGPGAAAAPHPHPARCRRGAGRAPGTHGGGPPCHPPRPPGLGRPRHVGEHGGAAAPGDDQPVRAGGRLRRRPGQAAAAGGTLAVRGEAAPGARGGRGFPQPRARRGGAWARSRSAAPRTRVGLALPVGPWIVPGPRARDRGSARSWASVRGAPGREAALNERGTLRVPLPALPAAGSGTRAALSARRGLGWALRCFAPRGTRRRWRGPFLLNGVLSFPVQPRQLARLELMDLTLVAPLQLKRLFCVAGLRRDAERVAQLRPAVGSSPSPARTGLPSVGTKARLCAALAQPCGT